MTVTVSWTIEPDRLTDLLGLLHSAWWMADRTPDDVARMLVESDLVVVLTQHVSDRVVGFARVLTDFTYVGLLLDVVVDPGSRGTGYGATLLDAVVKHPRLAQIRSLELVCQPELVPFYRRWGFTDEVGRSLLMRRTTDSRLTG
ncbi:GNAT family N-acetyltransferase [Kribbella sp. NPDC055071]